MTTQAHVRLHIHKVQSGLALESLQRVPRVGLLEIP